MQQITSLTPSALHIPEAKLTSFFNSHHFSSKLAAPSVRLTVHEEGPAVGSKGILEIVLRIREILLFMLPWRGRERNKRWFEACLIGRTTEEGSSQLSKRLVQSKSLVSDFPENYQPHILYEPTTSVMSTSKPVSNY